MALVPLDSLSAVKVSDVGVKRGLHLGSSLVPSTSSFQKIQSQGVRSRSGEKARVVFSVLDVRLLPERVSKHGKSPLLNEGKVASPNIAIDTAEVSKRFIPRIDEEQAEEDVSNKTMDDMEVRGFLLNCKRNKNVKEAFYFFGGLSSPKLDQYRLLLGVCADAADLEGAKKAFQAAKNDGFTRDRGLYTAFITACCRARQLDTAFTTFHEMQNYGVEADVITYGTLIDGCVKTRQVAKAFGVYGIMLSKGVKPDKIIFHSLMMACGKSENVDRAFDVLKDMKLAEIAPDHSTMTILLNVCTECGAVDRALGAYRVMRHKGAATTAAAFTSAINACSVSGSLDSARDIYKDMLRDNVKPDEIVFCALIKVAASAEAPNYAFYLMKEMKKQRVKMSRKTYNALLSMCAELNLPDKALNLYAEMKAESFSPDVVTFNALLLALCNAERMNEALLILDEMVEAGVRTSALTYKILLKGCANPISMNPELAFKLYHSADLEGKSANLDNCNSLIEICYNQITNNAPAPTFSVTAGRFSLDSSMTTPGQQWAWCALSIFRQIVSAGVKPSRATVSKLFGCLRKPKQGHSRSSSIAEVPPLFMAPHGTGVSVPFGLIEAGRTRLKAGGIWEEFFEPHAFSIYEEVAALGVLTSVSGSEVPECLDLRDFQSNAAKVCILSYLRNLKELKESRSWTSIPTLKLTLHPLEGCHVPRNPNVRALRSATRSTQAVIAFLNHIKLPFEGSAASGKLLIKPCDLEEWLRQQPAISASGSKSSAQNDFRLGQNLTGQQRAIRMGSSPLYSPSTYYSKPTYSG